MSFELMLFGSILHNSDPERAFDDAMDALTSPDVFQEKRGMLEYMLEHRQAYGKLPDLTTFEQHFSDTVLPKGSEPIRFYADKIYSSYVYSKMADLNEKLVEKLKQGAPVEALHMLSSELNTLSQSTAVSTDVDLAQSIQQRLDRYEKRRGLGAVTGIPCGWPRLDAETTGWHDSEVTYIVGRMGSFKTWMLLAWAIHAWQQGYSVLFFSREMGEAQISRRIDTFVTATRFKDVKAGTLTDDEWELFKAQIQSSFLGKHPFRIVDSARSGDYDTRFVSKKVREYRPDVVFIDGVYLMSGKGHSDWEKQTSISRDIKQIALNERVPIVGTLQANRGAAGEKEKVKMHNIAYSDAYGQDADNVITIGRQWDDRAEEFSKLLFVQLAKVRDGENVKVQVEVDLNNMRIAETLNTISTYRIESEEIEI